MQNLKNFFTTIFIFFIYTTLYAQDSTYAERLGYPKASKVIILHVDDAGLSYDSNDGVITALTKGVANSPV
jgi:hypothetical protein